MAKTKTPQAKVSKLDSWPAYTRYFESQQTPELTGQLAEADRLKAELDVYRKADSLAPNWEVVYSRLWHQWAIS